VTGDRFPTPPPARNDAPTAGGVIPPRRSRQSRADNPSPSTRARSAVAVIAASREILHRVPPRIRLPAAVAALIAVIALIAVGLPGSGGQTPNAAVAHVLNAYQTDLRNADYAALGQLLDADVVRRGPPGSCSASHGSRAVITSLRAQNGGAGRGYRLVNLGARAIVVKGSQAHASLDYRVTSGRTGAVRFDLVYHRPAGWLVTHIDSRCRT